MPASCQLKATAPVADSSGSSTNGGTAACRGSKTTPSTVCVAKVNCCLVMKNSHANLTPAPDKEAEAEAEANAKAETETVTNCASKL